MGGPSVAKVWKFAFFFFKIIKKSNFNSFDIFIIFKYFSQNCKKSTHFWSSSKCWKMLVFFIFQNIFHQIMLLQRIRSLLAKKILNQQLSFCVVKRFSSLVSSETTTYPLEVSDFYILLFIQRSLYHIFNIIICISNNAQTRN